MPEEALKAATERGVNNNGIMSNRNKNKLNKNGQINFFACGISSVIHPKNPHAVIFILFLLFIIYIYIYIIHYYS